MRYSDYIGKQVLVRYYGSDKLEEGTLIKVISNEESDDGYETLIILIDGKEVEVEELNQFIPKEMYDNPDALYYYVFFRFGKTDRSKTHIYMSWDDSIKPGDKVIEWNIWVGNVIDAGYYTRDNAPYPLEKTWLIYGKADPAIDYTKYEDYDPREMLSKDPCLSKKYRTKAKCLVEDFFDRYDGCDDAYDSQVQDFYKALLSVNFMVENNRCDLHTAIVYKTYKLIYQHGDFDEYLLCQSKDKAYIDEIMKTADAYLDESRTKSLLDDLGF